MPDRSKAAEQDGIDGASFASFINPADANPARHGFKKPFNHWTESPLAEERFDWRKRGLSFSVRSQGSANCCTSYALAAMAEARWKLRHGLDIRLAGAYPHICLLGITDPSQGANPEAVAGAATAGGLAKGTTDGPPISSGQCRHLGKDVIGVSAYGWIAPGIGMLNALVQRGPLLLEMDVPIDFPALRRHDVFSAPVDAATAKRHAMLLVGYDYPQRIGYLLNSMGSAWGNDGFLAVRFGVGGALDHYYGMQIDVAG